MAYKGTNYHGWQVQQNALSVCEVLQNAMEKVWHTRPDVKGCSRTDTGVHALAYCVSFILPKPISAYKLPLALNAHLPEDIRVLSAKEVDEDFHARYSSISKQYIYKVRNSQVANPFMQGLEWRVGCPLDVQAMQQAAAHYVGKKSFASFMSGGSKIVDTVREVFEFTVEKHEDNITFTVTADGYLYNMVRIMVGTLVEVGCHRIAPQQMPAIIAAENRSLAGPRAPSEGLYLSKVNY
ncbi:MAG: tRNA pseudouridine(38-40) synthase TruA [Oscillospiraceae bacterium]|nr:tRNA pseudouridine(38-40) synthase TruA [Oscillospiraceae bacterium]